MDTKTQRLDPQGCGCTDCLTGYSVPIDSATQEQLAAFWRGELDDATSGAIVERVVNVDFVVSYPPL